MKSALILLSFLLVACNPVRPDDPSADRPIYKPYKIEIPQRPTLTADKVKSSDSDGVAARAIESDNSLLQEYATKLENVLLAIPKNVSVK